MRRSAIISLDDVASRTPSRHSKKAGENQNKRKKNVTYRSFNFKRRSRFRISRRSEMMDTQNPKANKLGNEAIYKKAREERRELLTPSHKYIFDILAERLSLTPSEVEEFVLDSPSTAPPGGAQGVPRPAERHSPSSVSWASSRWDMPGTPPEEGIRYRCPSHLNWLLSMWRSSGSTPSPSRMAELLTLSLRECPATLRRKLISAACIRDLSFGRDPKFMAKDLQVRNDSVVHLSTVSDVDFSKLTCVDEMKAAAANTAMVQRLEEILGQWCKEIEQVLTMDDQLRKIDSEGPLSELEYWKKKYLQFTYIVNHTKSKECKAVVMVLHIQRSKMMKVWHELDNRITDCVNEAKDYLKFLSTLEKVLHALYKSDPDSLMKSVHSLISVIELVYRVPLFRNTNEKIPALFIKVTNQLVTACRAHITDQGKSFIWDQDGERLIGKMQDCITLFQEYQSCFQKTRRQATGNPGKNSFEVSERQIFGMFENFCKRLEKIKQIITVFKTFESLGKSKIEGIESFARQFQNVSLSLKRKQYDMLAPKMTEFEADFVKFMAEISLIETKLQQFMNSCFSNILSSQKALALLQRFQKLKLPCLDTQISNILHSILQCYVSEVESIKKLFDEEKKDPPLARNMPPVAGRIGWVRHLFRKIEEPIFYIKENSNTLSSPEGKKVVKMYNKTATILVEFECLQYQTWIEDVSKLENILNHTLLKHQSNTNKFFVNFDPKINEVIREAKCLSSMGLEVPKQAVALLNLERKLHDNHLRLKTILEEYESICNSICEDFSNLLASKKKKVHAALCFGSLWVTWSSFILDKFFQNVDTALAELKHLVNKVQDICKIQIDDVLKDISETVLIELPEDQALCLQDLVVLNKNLCREWANTLNIRCSHIKGAIKELGIVLRGTDEQKGQDTTVNFQREFKKLYELFSMKVFEALVRTTKLSLDILKRRICGTTTFKKRKPGPKMVPLIKSEVQLDKQKVVMIPSIDEIQQGINQLTHSVLEVNSSQRTVASAVLEQFSPFKMIWEVDKNLKVKEFEDNNPSLMQIRSEIQHYDSVEQEIDDIRPVIHIGSIELSTGSLKKALTAETKAWKNQICKYLKEKYKTKKIDIAIQTHKYSAQLSNPVADLEGARQAMGTLSRLRDAEIQIDMTLISIKRSVQAELVRMEPKFKQDLLESVTVFKKDVDTYMKQFDSARFEELWKKFTTYTSAEQLLGLPVTDYNSLHVKKKEFDLLQKLYGLYNAVMSKIDGYYKILWTCLDIEKINTELMDFQNRCRKLPKALKEWQAFLDLKRTIDDFSESCPLLEMMANKSMKRRHWDRIASLTGHHFEVESVTFTLWNIMEAPLLTYKDDIEDICISAVKEKDIEAKLSQVKELWSGQTLCLMTFKNRGELMLKGADTTEILTILEDSLMVLGSLLSNRYCAFYKAEIQDWVSKLSTSSETIELWIIVQNLWIYLEAVFVGGDIAKDLPQEAKRFQDIDISWIRVMKRAQKVPNVVECCVGDPTLGQVLSDLQKQLELCQKSLTGYLEKKRLLFPRFFFVSDPALLEILGQASDSHTIQSHLLGVFDNVNEAEFDGSEYDKILTVVSQEGERLPLDSPVMAQGPVELWLGELLQQQQASLHSVIRSSDWEINDEDFDLLPFLDNYQAQVGLLGIQMLWTRDAEEALQNAEMDKEIMVFMKMKFLKLLSVLIKQTTCDLSKFDRVKYETLVTIHVHQSDIFNDLVKKRVKCINDFEWLKQSRFYFKESIDKVIVSITNVDFLYQNEFLGCTDRLVITPLTDRCYITLAQALGMSMGGAPAGPAGTGKTETTKDMGRCLGKYVVVFNCSDQMDFRGLGRIYKGLAQSGSWGCFDEFNRIDLPVLSVAAQQISIVLSARKKHKSTFIFTDGDLVDLNPEFGLFITMNPGYAGRQELPENLKVQFRTVSMMVPDRQIIMRVKLASCGFDDNVILAQKFFVLYKLCEEQLTKQVHYDFGLRNILSVLRTLGACKRVRPDDTESSIVMRVLRDMNLSKLVDEDEPLFLSLINDLFPGIQLDGSTHVELQAAVANQVELAGLVNHPPWNLKLVQLYEAAQVRHGLMALGPSGAGKTTSINILMKSMTECGTPHREMRMNPKAITAPQMFGRLDAATNDWTDGIFSTLWRRSLKAKKGEAIWIVLDGPVDAIWIENLNSVLDDNKTLTLANGDRITMSPTCKLVFEVHNMDNASPATVSRVGMVFMSSSALSWQPILQGWAKKRNAKEAESILSLYNKVFADVYLYMKQNLKPKMELLECNYIMQSVNLLEGFLPTKEIVGFAGSKHLERLFVFCLMWSIGAILELDDRDKLEEYIRGHEIKIDLPQIRPGETMFEYMVDTNGEWCHWNNHVGEYFYPTDDVPDYPSILVPNVDNTRTCFLLETIAKQRKAVLLIGEQGTAKTVMIKAYAKKCDPEKDLFKSLNFSSATEPIMFQRTVESYIEKRIGSTYGPPGGRRMTVFIDDINMPIVNKWGDQITNEIVRQMMEMGGMYNLDKPGDFTTVEDVQILAAMIHPGGGRNDIPERLKRQFTIFNCTLPSNTSIDKIFGIIGCGYFHECRNFKQIISQMVKCLVPAGRILWQWTKAKMLPTPSKFHYIFNLRDLSRIWQGMLNIKAEECQNIPTLLALFKSECTRVIADRFICSNDKEWFEEKMCHVIQDIDSNLLKGLHPEPFFVDFLRDVPEPTGEEEDEACLDAPKVYEMVPDFKFLAEKLKMYQSQHNEVVKGSSLDLVFFKDAMTHLVKVSRIIRTDNGNALLVGVGGSGKQSLARLASYIAGYSVFQITLTRSYNMNNFMDDLKLLYKTAGAEGQGITFIFTDNEIKDEAFLEHLNNVLSSGEVSNLFAKDEIQEITQNLVPIMKKEFPRLPPTFDNLYEYFIARAKKNLHVVLCFSPVGQRFRCRCQKFPGLISGCTMDWYSPWPSEALVAVSSYFLSEFPVVCSATVKASLMTTMGAYHDRVSNACESYFESIRRRTHVTPKSYLSFINGYKTLYSEKHNYINTLAERMNVGLDKLREASESVAQLSKYLEVKEKELAVASIKADKVLAEVTVSADAATKVKNEVQVVRDKAQTLVDGIEKEKAIAENKLEAARPALEEATAALNTIKPADIATVRKLAKPPHLIMRIMDCVLILFNKKLDSVSVDPERRCIKPSWTEAMKLLSSPGFLTSLQNFPKDQINDETVELLRPYFEMEDYTMENAMKACGNVAGLLAWTRAMASFFSINKEVLPLKANLAIQENRLNLANNELGNAEAQLAEKQAEFDKVKAKCDAAMKEKQDLLDDAEMCRNKMQAASALIDGLSGEKIRWTEQSKEFKSQINRLVGDVLQLTGFLSYCGPFNQTYRDKLLKEWQAELLSHKIPFTDNLNIISALVDPPTISEWNLQGLPGDDLSVQNGIVVTKATRYPLLIDPQTQGRAWIKKKEAANQLQVTSLNHKFFRTHLEDCLSLGRPLLIADIFEELDPALDNVLEKNFIKSGTSYKVKVGDKEINVMNGFRLYITTKLPNPAYTPEVSARTSIIDFTVNIKALENQLLGRVILKEKQELEAERLKLMEDVTANKRKMQELEDNLLYKLSSTKGSLVDDESMIGILHTTKQTAAKVSEKLSVAAEAEAKINLAQSDYRPVASRGSILYFLITEMSMVNVMYQTSLGQFLKVFDLSLERSEKSSKTKNRIANIIEYLTFEVFRYTVRGLYENHKFVFTLLLALKIDLQNNKIENNKFQILTKGGAALDLNTSPEKSCDWLDDVVWLNLVELSKLPQFANILNQLSQNKKNWKAWLNLDAPEEGVIPDGYNSIDVFHKLLLIRCWCPERTLSQAMKYVEDSMGSKFAEPVILNLYGTWNESDSRTPLICFLSMGSDPTDQIEALAKKLQLECRAISMGQGQEVHARKLLKTSMTEGGWVLLQNCHLGLEFMDELLETITTAESMHDTFRVWITTEPHSRFSITLLQSSIKFTNDPPQGIRAGLKRTFGGISQNQLEASNLPMWKPLLYSVAFLHTVVQERRKFGPLGWNIPYEFNSADFSASVEFVEKHLDDCGPKQDVSWVTVRYMLAEVQYGGRVTDDYDKRLLKCFARVWFSKKMLDPSFGFYTGYKIPVYETVDDYMNYIQSLPTVDSPEALGLHSNADITYQKNTSAEVLDTITNIQPKESGEGSGETRESSVYNSAEHMLDKLPPDYVPHEVKAKLQEMGALNPMNIFLRQEVDRMQRIISVVRSSLTDLKLAIDGTIIMNDNLRDILDNIFYSRVPSLWRNISWDSSTSGLWMANLVDRNEQFTKWVSKGRPNTFWMAGFFNPQGFLTAMRQEVTRANKGWALDTVTINNKVLTESNEKIKAPPTEGVYVYGLHLDGAGWNIKNIHLKEPTPKVLFTCMPVIHMFAVRSTAPTDPKLYVCPIYKKSKRTDQNYITAVALPTALSPDHWIMRGVALLCDTT
ncbi:Dynein heavy chain 8, axonemal [Crenichthys baileyi]|uniref:Dynein heavy chain 8, axonemal n=1 Tax=Crenichthys baileyi TaxID=28760 RepID=A0AAV9RE46_9TELE